VFHVLKFSDGQTLLTLRNFVMKFLNLTGNGMDSVQRSWSHLRIKYVNLCISIHEICGVGGQASA
jgi:hypothetical protein